MTPEEFKFKNPPYKHQEKIFLESCEKEYVSLFLDPGLGKTFIIINKVAYLYKKGEIDALVVIAPNGVHLNWSSDEFPEHMPLDVMKETLSFGWQSSKAKTKRAKEARDKLLTHKGLSVLLVAYEATITPLFKDYMKKFFAKRKVFMTLDESHRIKGRTAKCKLTITAMGGYAKYRRILTGTPLEIPVDLYSQVRFLSPSYWKDNGFSTAAEFDAHFCIQVPNRFSNSPRAKPQVVGYKNMDLLKELVAKTGYRMTLDDAGIHLPPITYSKRYYEMFPEQRAHYEQLVNEFKTELDDGLVVEAEAAITRLLRLQQVICGYVGTLPGEPIRRLHPTKNPRLELCVDEILPDLKHQVILWCRFTEDINQLVKALGKEAVRYDGQVGNDDRVLAKEKFQAGDVKYIIMSEAGAEGLTLVGAKTAIFYSNSYKMIKRRQMEGRNYRIGQTDKTQVIDIICQGTVDNDIVVALRNKMDLASQLTGDTLREWL